MTAEHLHPGNRHHRANLWGRPPGYHGHRPADSDEALEGFDFQDTGAEDRHEVVPAWARDWQATLFDHGWMIPSYPKELGGREATPLQTMVYLEEMARRRIAQAQPPLNLKVER